MRIMSLQQFIQQASEPRITHLSWILAELKSDIGNFADNYSVDIMVNSEEPGKIWMVFQKGEDGCLPR